MIPVWYNVYGGERMNLKNEFENIARKYIKREGLEDLLEWLSDTDFYLAPASSRYHGAHEGGLVIHSLNVFKRLKDLLPMYDEGNTITMESAAIVALFHDLCKVDFYKVSSRNVKNEVTGRWEKKPYYTYEEFFPYGGHGSKSVYLTQNFMKLAPDEAASINCHMGPWDRQDYGRPGDVFGVNLLAWLVHIADEAATYIDKT